MKHFHIAFAALALLASSSTARATGGFDCIAGTDTVTFYASGVLGRGVVTPIMNFKAHLILKVPEVAKTSLEFDLSDALLFSWVEDNELRLHLYKEQSEGQRPPSVELIMKAASADEDGIIYEGSYVLRTQALPAEGSGGPGNPVELKGEIACGWE